MTGLFTFGIAVCNAAVIAGGTPIAAKTGRPVSPDCALVLGARVYADGGVSPVLEDRLETALALYRDGRVSRILVSGDHGTTTYDEVNAMRRWLEARGVPPKDVFLDHAGFDTYSSIRRARDIFRVERAEARRLRDVSRVRHDRSASVDVDPQHHVSLHLLRE